MSDQPWGEDTVSLQVDGNAPAPGGGKGRQGSSWESRQARSSAVRLPLGKGIVPVLALLLGVVLGALLVGGGGSAPAPPRSEPAIGRGIGGAEREGSPAHLRRPRSALERRGSSRMRDRGRVAERKDRGSSRPHGRRTASAEEAPPVEAPAHEYSYEPAYEAPAPEAAPVEAPRGETPAAVEFGM